MRGLAGSALVICLALGSALGFGHAGEQLIPLRLAVASWSSALQGADVAELDSLLSPGFEGRGHCLARVPMEPTTRVVLTHATYRLEGRSALVSPVVLYPMREMHNPTRSPCHWPK